MPRNTDVIEGWTGPGRADGHVTPLPLSEDGMRLDLDKRKGYEWWYFDAHLDTGHTIVVFFYASNPNPGRTGKTGIEIVLLRPNGKRVQEFVAHRRPAFAAAREWPEVTIGKNTLRAEQLPGALALYQVTVEGRELACQLTFTAEVNGWKPGSGLSHFGDLGYFGWVVPFARASVRGTIRDGGQILQVSGVGYHDHNWLNFPFQTIIDYWMWGRIYSQSFTVAYAYIQCNSKVNNHVVKVLMLAEGQEVTLSTGEFALSKHAFQHSPAAKHSFPGRITIDAPNRLHATLEVSKVLEAQDMLQNFNPLLRLLARHVLRMKPGYFRLISDFALEVTHNGHGSQESGSTLHEMVLFKPIQSGAL